MLKLYYQFWPAEAGMHKEFMCLLFSHWFLTYQFSQSTHTYMITVIIRDLISIIVSASLPLHIVKFIPLADLLGCLCLLWKTVFSFSSQPVVGKSFLPGAWRTLHHLHLVTSWIWFVDHGGFICQTILVQISDAFCKQISWLSLLIAFSLILGSYMNNELELIKLIYFRWN